MTQSTVARQAAGAESPNSARRVAAARKQFLLRQFMQWHWVSASIALVGMILFAATGITLNHAADIDIPPVVRQQTGTLPAHLRLELANATVAERGVLPPGIAGWLHENMSVRAAGREAEWSDEEIYLTIARPGGSSVIVIERASGGVAFEDTSRGWIAYLNDLHKGRNTGAYWSWFIDLFAAACVVFCVTGLGLLWLKAPARRSTWPLVGLGVLIPLLLALFFIH